MTFGRLLRRSRFALSVFDISPGLAVEALGMDRLCLWSPRATVLLVPSELR